MRPNFTHFILCNTSLKSYCVTRKSKNILYTNNLIQVILILKRIQKIKTSLLDKSQSKIQRVCQAKHRIFLRKYFAEEDYMENAKFQETANDLFYIDYNI